MKAEFPAGSLPEGLAARVDAHYAERPFSIFWETRALLGLGVMGLSAGLGILVYKNIDTIGHQAILAVIALLAAACFAYCFRRAPAFSWGRPAAESSSVDYLLWLGALLLGTFVGYLQARYHPFGDRTALAVAAPALAYLALAYRFDHRGVLQLGISGLFGAAGVAVSPLALFGHGLLELRAPVAAGLLMAALWGALAFTARAGYKPHFAFSYANFAVHLGMIACLTGLGSERGLGELLFVAPLAAGTWALWTYARRAHSAYFVLLAVAYGYIGVTLLCIRHVFSHGWGAGELVMLYFLLSCAATIWLFLNLKNLAGKDDDGDARV